MRPLADVVRAGLYLSSGEKRNPKATSRLTIVTSSIRLIIAMSFAAFAILNPESRLFSATVAVSIAGLTLMSLVGTGILLRREARRTPGAIGPKYVDVTDQYLGTLATSSGAVLRWSTILRLEFSDGDIYYSTGSGGMALLPSRAFDSVDGAQYAFQQKIGFRDEAVRVRLAKFGLRFRLRRSTRIHFQESVQTWMPIKR